MNTALLTLLVVSVLMGTMAGGFGAVWVVNRITRPSVGRGVIVCAVMGAPVVVGFVVAPVLVLVLLWTLGAAMAVLRELYLIDCGRLAAVTPNRTEDMEVEVLSSDERERYLAEIDAYRSQH